jgi:hypothetical protein
VTAEVCDGHIGPGELTTTAAGRGLFQHAILPHRPPVSLSIPPRPAWPRPCVPNASAFPKATGPMKCWRNSEKSANVSGRLTPVETLPPRITICDCGYRPRIMSARREEPRATWRSPLPREEGFISVHQTLRRACESRRLRAKLRRISEKPFANAIGAERRFGMDRAEAFGDIKLTAESLAD